MNKHIFYSLMLLFTITSYNTYASHEQTLNCEINIKEVKKGSLNTSLGRGGGSVYRFGEQKTSLILNVKDYLLDAKIKRVGFMYRYKDLFPYHAGEFANVNTLEFTKGTDTVENESTWSAQIVVSGVYYATPFNRTNSGAFFVETERNTYYWFNKAHIAYNNFTIDHDSTLEDFSCK